MLFRLGFIYGGFVIWLFMSGCGGQYQRVQESGQAFLVEGQPEAEGYGLYSYLLFGAPPNDAVRERYQRAVEAYLKLLPEIEKLHRYYRPDNLNITYLPVTTKPPFEYTRWVISEKVEWILEHYDYLRARVILNTVDESNRSGPYILSFTTPLTGPAITGGHYLYQNMSWVHPKMMELWMTHFLRQATKEQFWKTARFDSFVLKLRTTLAVLAEGIPEVKKSVDSLRTSLNGWVALRQPN